jgi:XTP/dITP diphosphohydrolase
MQELLIATTNPGKLGEITRILHGVPITLKTLADFPQVAVAEETGSSFGANARHKAMHYAAATRMVTLAEDSGFEVDALNGEPGIHSARYLRDGARYDERFAHIYQRVRDSASTDRRARFVCALTVADGLDVLFETTARVEGLLADAPSGTNGFGYDPIFFYPPYGQTFGDVTDEQKCEVSHRWQAIRAFRSYLLRTGIRS